MIVVACAWHRKFFGRPKFLRVASWRGWGVRWSHGLCRLCRVQLNDDAAKFADRMARMKGA